MGTKFEFGSSRSFALDNSNKEINCLSENTPDKTIPLIEGRSLGMSTITKKKLIQNISQARGLHPNDVRNVIQAFLDAMTDTLSQGDRLEFRDFGVFEIVERKQKIGRNPKNAAVPIVIPARKAVKFTPGKKMRKLIE
jgi:nucleoid DNA-binding protein